MAISVVQPLVITAKKEKWPRDCHPFQCAPGQRRTGPVLGASRLRADCAAHFRGGEGWAQTECVWSGMSVRNGSDAEYFRENFVGLSPSFEPSFLVAGPPSRLAVASLLRKLLSSWRTSVAPEGSAGLCPPPASHRPGGRPVPAPLSTAPAPFLSSLSSFCKITCCPKD